MASASARAALNWLRDEIDKLSSAAAPLLTDPGRRVMHMSSFF
jgi:hypothetical protein